MENENLNQNVLDNQDLFRSSLDTLADLVPPGFDRAALVGACTHAEFQRLWIDGAPRAWRFRMFDGDGDQDLFIGVLEGGDLGAIEGRSRLYLNDGSGKFRRARPGTLPNLRDSGGTCVAADYDRDGDIDIYVSNAGPNAGDRCRIRPSLRRTRTTPVSKK